MLSDICTAAYGLGQLYRVWTLPEKQSMSFYFGFLVFVLVGLWISSTDHREQATDKTRETRWAYRWWTVWAGIDLAVLIYMRINNHIPLWNDRDALNMSIASASTVLGLLIGWITGRYTIFNNPYVKAWVMNSLKSLLQFLLAETMIHSFGASPDPIAIVAGLVTIAVRLVILHSTVKTEGWNAHRRGLALAEYPNFISWLCVALVYVGWLFLGGRM